MISHLKVRPLAFIKFFVFLIAPITSFADIDSTLINYCVQTEKDIRAGFQPGEFEKFLPAGSSYWSTVKKTVQGQEYFLLWEGSRMYWALSNNVKKVAKSECLKRNQCATILPNSSPYEGAKNINLPAQAQYPIINMKTKSSSLISYQLKLTDADVWIDNTSVATSELPCKSVQKSIPPIPPSSVTNPPKNTPSEKNSTNLLQDDSNTQAIQKDSEQKSNSRKYSKWKFAFTGGTSLFQSNKSFENFITNIPNTSDVSKLQTPLISEISTGTGFLLGPRVSFDPNDDWRSLLGLYYQQLTYTYSGRLNPSVTSVSFDSLSAYEDTFTTQFLIVDLSLLAKSKIKRKLFIHYGLGLDFGYRLSEQNHLTIRTGNVFKATESTLTGGPEQTTVRFLPRLEIEWGQVLLIARISTLGEMDLMFGWQFGE
jgi:hypothetical protein